MYACIRKTGTEYFAGVCRQEELSRVLEELLGEGGTSDEDA
jgi:hypothetical protein